MGDDVLSDTDEFLDRRIRRAEMLELIHTLDGKMSAFEALHPGAVWKLTDGRPSAGACLKYLRERIEGYREKGY